MRRHRRIRLRRREARRSPCKMSEVLVRGAIAVGVPRLATKTLEVEHIDESLPH